MDHYELNGSVVRGAAIEADGRTRGRFIVNTYLHLFAAIVAFVLLTSVWFITPVASIIMGALVSAGRVGMVLLMLGFVGASTLADRWARDATSLATQYLGLGLYVVAESLLFVPLIAITVVRAAETNPYILPEAGLLTTVLFGCLTGVVFITRQDFSFLRSVLLWGGIAALVLALGSVIFGFSLGLFFSWAMVALAGGYILYDTSNVLHRYRTTQHVSAALALFASFTLLLWYVIRILGRRR